MLIEELITDKQVTSTILDMGYPEEDLKKVVTVVTNGASSYNKDRFIALLISISELQEEIKNDIAKHLSFDVKEEAINVFTRMIDMRLDLRERCYSCGILSKLAQYTYEPLFDLVTKYYTNYLQADTKFENLVSYLAQKYSGIGEALRNEIVLGALREKGYTDQKTIIELLDAAYINGYTLPNSMADFIRNSSV